MAQINPYIHFNGNAEEAFLFYKSVFGGEFSAKVRLKDMAGNTGNPIAEIDANKNYAYCFASWKGGCTICK